MTETTQKCQLTLQVPHMEYTRHAKTMFKGSHHKQNVAQHCMGARIWKATESAGCDGHQDIVYFHRDLWHFLWWKSLDIVELKGLIFRQIQQSTYRVVSRENYFRKTSRLSKSKACKQGHLKNFQNHEITCKESICSKRLKLKEK